MMQKWFSLKRDKNVKFHGIPHWYVKSVCEFTFFSFAHNFFRFWINIIFSRWFHSNLSIICQQHQCIYCYDFFFRSPHAYSNTKISHKCATHTFVSLFFYSFAFKGQFTTYNWISWHETTKKSFEIFWIWTNNCNRCVLNYSLTTKWAFEHHFVQQKKNHKKCLPKAVAVKTDFNLILWFICTQQIVRGFVDIKLDL